ncbi:MAG: SDR family oxidoreductase [Giesbergeria sp.]|jgi:NAD(P)-dependent dehydrogenase (short-subunit alcohol dehydrogenase family)|nr:SDR family oxidoreductase [Giesbergeria sp.]MBP6158554.1 SDR family oxidoreductase [Giesbergeria sp.]MBP7082461.1 SDR family oxidoreductase [Giesbergeria sp.]MBP9783735.1 SDR family oxidoreductase [Giesbergeria sp.]MBP9894961.1 SDR family oxidoreductase [Giesbergeria sp.]
MTPTLSNIAAPSAPRHALVTGGGQGIGAAIAHLLVRRGMRVTVLGRRLATGQVLAAEPPDLLHAVAADVANASEVAAAFADAVVRFGRVDVLVNNAGQAESAPFLKMDEVLWRRMLDVNLTGTMLCTQAALPGMLEAGWGRIVNVASTAGQVGYAYVSAYCAAKHGVVGLTRALALEVASKGITVNAVCPGYTDTEIVRASIERVVAKTGRSEQEARAAFVQSNPQGRLVAPQEVADAVAWLCSEGASAITGQALSVSGGEVM